MAPPDPIQPLDLTSLRAVLAELRPLLLPSRFEKAQQADSSTVQLALRHLGGVQWLELSWQAEAPRLLAIGPPPRQGEGSTLAQQLQHGLRGLALVSLGQPGWERVVALGFAARPGEPVHRTLVLELMGRHSNLFLLDEGRRVIALGRQVRPGQSRWRPIGTGDPYQPPPPLQGREPSLNEPQQAWQRQLTLVPLTLQEALLQSYQGVSPALGRQLLAGLEESEGTPDVQALLRQPVGQFAPAFWDRLYGRWQQWLKAMDQGAYGFRLEEAGGYCCWSQPAETAPLAINRSLAAYYGQRLGQRRQRQQHQALRQRLEQAITREQNQRAQQQALLEAAAGREELQRQADQLLSQPNLQREQVAEAQALYKRARKLRRSVEAITPRLEAHQQRLEALEASLLFLEQSGPVEDLAPLEEELAELLEGLQRRPGGQGQRSGARGQRPGRRRQGQPATGREEPSPLERRSSSGLRLQVGRNHRQNAWISLSQARRGDLWFHAQEVPGSHVVLKASEGLAQDSDLAEAADLAAYFSRARGNRRVPVVMVPIESLQRIPGAVLGTVRHRGGEILWGEPERARQRLESL